MNDKSLPSMKDLETEWPGVFVNNEVTMNYLIAKNVLVVPTQCKFCGAGTSVKRGHYFVVPMYKKKLPSCSFNNAWYFL